MRFSITITALGEEFAVLFERDDDYAMRWHGEAYPIYKYSDGEYSFISNQSSDSESDIKKARCMFHFSFCWRGVWEGRIYFKDEEYWSEELSTMSNLWDQIEARLKKQIKQDNPDYGHFDE